MLVHHDALCACGGADQYLAAAQLKPSKKAMAEKLKALELSGLVDFTEEHAK